MSDAANAELDTARAIIARAESDLRRALSQGERRDLLKDNTAWTSQRCDEIVLALEAPPESDAPNLVPKWEGQFDTFAQWVNRASIWLTGRTGSVGEELRPICVDTLGRRCHNGKDFMRARDEGTFPVRFFWECEPAEAGK